MVFNIIVLVLAALAFARMSLIVEPLPQAMISHPKIQGMITRTWYFIGACFLFVLFRVWG